MMWLDVWSAIERHGDQANKDNIKQVIQYGIPIYSCEETREIDKRIINIKKGRKTSIGGFKIQPIPLQHSVQCFGFLIEHDDFGRLVFATDCSSFPYLIKNVNHFLIECNWSEDVLIDNICNNDEMRSRHEHHLELENTIMALSANYSSSLQTILLLHLSNGNSNEEMFKSRISEELGFFNVFIANKGLKIELNKEDF
jgi:ribonuclease BN (tRNA processing enzyme)